MHPKCVKISRKLVFDDSPFLHRCRDIAVEGVVFSVAQGSDVCHDLTAETELLSCRKPWENPA